jgi:N-acetylglucosamine kinase-like BadF-type ATPase
MRPRAVPSAAGLALGVDAGGSKTDALVCDVDGGALGYATAGPGNWETVGLDGMCAALETAAAGALAAAGADRSDVAAACFGLAGLDWPADEAILDGAIAGLGIAGARVVVNDVFLPLRATCRTPCAAASSAGTGSVACGRDAAGRTFRTMGIGLGERGGAGDIADALLDRIAAAHHGIAPPTALEERALASTGEPSRAALFEAASRGTLGWRRYDLARVVLGAAGAGDPDAVAIAGAAGAALGHTVAGVAGLLGIADEELDVVRSGGVHGAGCTALDDAFAAAVFAACPHARLKRLAAPPAVGAALLALDRTGGVPLETEDRLVEHAARLRAAAATGAIA